jgi:hypothetical protein
MSTCSVRWIGGRSSSTSSFYRFGISVLERGRDRAASGIRRVPWADHQVDAYFVPAVIEPDPEPLHEELC